MNDNPTPDQTALQAVLDYRKRTETIDADRNKALGEALAELKKNGVAAQMLQSGLTIQQAEQVLRDRVNS